MPRAQESNYKEVKWKSFLSWFFFSGFFSFAIGGLFLLFFMVPIEQWFFNEGLSQRGLDLLMNSLIGLYAFSMVVISIYYYFRIIKRGRKKLTYSLLAASLVLAGYVFYLFLSPTSLAIQQLQGEVEEVDRFVFGPYPDEEKLRQLKEEGYAGVITLLSPTIPFEKVLLEQELANGQEVGISVKSFPMLPWVSDNKQALDSIEALVQENEGKYYVHCYLGKHRVDLARTSIFEVVGKERSKAVIFPDKIERGPIMTFNENSLVLGPFPTDEEWFHIVLRPGTKELISTLDPEKDRNKSWIEKARKIAMEHDIIFTEIVVKGAEDQKSLTKLYDYVTHTDHSKYVFDFRGGEVIKSLEAKLNGIKPFVNSEVPNQFERGETIKIGRWLLVGPYPTLGEFSKLKQAGFTQFISLLDDEKEEDVKWIKEEKNWATNNAVQFQHFPLHEENIEAKQLYDILNYLDNNVNAPVYIHGFKTDKRVKLLARLAQGYFYGVDESEFIIEKLIPESYYVQNNLLVGSVPTENEWVSNLAFAGVRHVIVVPVAGFTNQQQIIDMQKLTDNLPVSFHSIQLTDTYIDEIKEYLQDKKGLIYIMTAKELAEGLSQKLDEELLY